MSVNGWILLWKAVLVAGLVLFTVMSVWVIGAGYGDIQSMYRRLSRKNKLRSRPRR
jgi:hypothetical protein